MYRFKGEFMKFMSRLLVRGTYVLLPIGVTLYVIYWVTVYSDKLLGAMVRPIVPEIYFWPGIGLVAGLAAILGIGILATLPGGRWLFGVIERVCSRTPLVKTVFLATQDFSRLFLQPHEHGGFGQAVWVPFGDMHLIGFVTRGPSYGAADHVSSDPTVAVYVSMSAGIGGFTVYLPRSKLEPTGLSVEEAMRLVMTAGVSMTERPRAAPPPSAKPAATGQP
jgi:uncharacterized membrane protein